MADMVRITDVAPRDGLQNEPGVISVEQKLELVRRLGVAGVDEIEVGSFVSPQWVPQMAGSAELCGRIAGEPGFQADAGGPTGRVMLSALVPNEKGLAAALAVNETAGRRLLRKVSVFTAASEEFARRNTNATIAETLERFRPVVRSAHAAGLLVRGYVSCVVACPFTGAIEPAAVVEVSRRLLELGIDELDWGDTIGAATPDSLGLLFDALQGGLPAAAWGAATLHLHDTFGRAGECIARALERGLRSFDGAAGGLGGCPYASTPEHRAPGNVATEALVEVVRTRGFSSRVDRERLADAARYAARLRAGT